MPESNNPSIEVRRSEEERSAAAAEASEDVLSALFEAFQKGEIKGGVVGGQIIQFETEGKLVKDPDTGGLKYEKVIPDLKKTIESSGYRPLDRGRVFSEVGADKAIDMWEYRNRLARRYAYLLFKHPYEEESGKGSGSYELGSLGGDSSLIEKLQMVYDQLLEDLKFLRENNPEINHILEERRRNRNR
ncbi:MAG: hypothetical protein AAB402_03815 [Patescibacteria group bacterium]